MANDFDEHLYEQDEVARRLRVSPRTLEKWRRTNGGPPYVRLGATVRYRASSLSRWLDELESDEKVS